MPSPSKPAEHPPDSSLDPATFRAALRREKIAARQAMTAEDRIRRSAQLEEHLWALLAGRGPATIAFCWPMRGEFDCRPLVMRLLSAGWRACQPVVTAPDTAMTFRAWTPDTAMTTDPYGIPVPANAETAMPEVILLPVVAFDRACFRLGYGGGYFDRTLAALTPRPITVGVGFELARTGSIVPQPHDLPLDAVATEAGVIKRTSAG